MGEGDCRRHWIYSDAILVILNLELHQNTVIILLNAEVKNGEALFYHIMSMSERAIKIN